MEKIWIKNYPLGVPAEVTIPDITVGQMLEATAQRFPTNNAIAFLGKRMDYQELNGMANRFANALAGLGVGKGDRVAIQLLNTPQLVAAYYGTLKLGAVAVMFNPLYSSREIEHQLIDSGARVMVTLDILFPNVEKALENASLEYLILTSVDELLKPPGQATEGRLEVNPFDFGLSGVTWFSEFVAEASAYRPDVRVDPGEDMAVLQYTGGTTGVSKGAMLTHRNLIANATQLKTWFTSAEDGREVVLCTLPFFHSYGMTVDMNIGILIGAKLVLVPNPRDIDAVLKAIIDEKPTMFPGVPTSYISLINHPDVQEDRVDMGSIRDCMSGAAPLPVEVQKEFERLTGGRLVEGYGLSEASPVTHGNPLDGVRMPGSIGMPFPSTEVKLVEVDDRTKEAPAGEPGELVVRGPQVMKGYWNMPEETEMVLEDGWLYTGDIATMDGSGFFYIVDRKKDLIISGGYNIYPRDVEEILFEYPKVEEAAVAGVPHPTRGETVKAYVVLKEGETATEQEIMEFCKERLSTYKVPSSVEFRSELPKTMVGKVLRRVLVEQEKAVSTHE